MDTIANQHLSVHTMCAALMGGHLLTMLTHIDADGVRHTMHISKILNALHPLISFPDCP